MNTLGEVGSTVSTEKNDTLLCLFASYVGEDVKGPSFSDAELLGEPMDVDDYDAIEAHERRCKLKIASSVLLKTLDNVNYTDAGGETFLHHFLEVFLNESCNVSFERLSIALKIVTILLERGASVDIKDNAGFSPIQMVVENQHKEMLALILTKLQKICLCSDKKCRGKYRCSKSTNCLHIDITDFAVDVLKICFDNAVSFDVHTNSNETPIIIACKYPLNSTDESKQLALASQLINIGCNVNGVDSDGYSALHYAVERQGSELVKRLIELGADVNQLTAKLHTPLYLALQKKSLKKIEMLLKAGANVNGKFADTNFTPLTFALINLQNTEITCSLIRNGADVNSRYKVLKNITPLLFAMMNVHQPETIRCMIESGADINCRDEISRFKPLHFAALTYDSELFNLILEKGCDDVNDRAACDLTALHLASNTGRYEIVKTLIERGADVNVRESKNGLTPIHMASMNTAVFNNLMKDAVGHLRNIAGRCYLKNCCYSTVIGSLIKGGANINAKDSRGMTPVHYASRISLWRKEKYDRLPTLLSLGAHDYLQANDGHLPLHNAIKDRNLIALMYLLNYGADLDDIKQELLNAPWILSSYDIGSNELEEAFKYMIKLKIAELPSIDIHCRDSLYDFRFSNTLYREYLEEVKKLKNYFLEDRISLYDWLHRNYVKARPFYLNGLPDELRFTFPHYFEIIEARYNNFIKRIPLLEPAKLAWYQITKIDLPEMCVERILFYLSNKYLQLLADSSVNENM